MERKIDLVYLWLDGNDKNWRKEKDKWQAIESGKTKISSEGTIEARWRENDELKYSLRSAEKFAPWINHIYIVTGFGQVPSWLDTSNPKITMIDHSQIMPSDALPNFNSTAIENCIINIPGLSEFFIYSNDDTFFGRPIQPDYFFDEEGHVVVWHNVDKRITSYKKALKVTGSEYGYMIYSTARIFELLFGFNMIKFLPSHNIEAYKKSSIKEVLTNPLVDMYYQKTIRRKFRSKFDLQRWFFTLYDIVFGKAVTHRIHTKQRVFYHFYKIIDKFYNGFKDSPSYSTNAKKRWIKKFEPPLFCINDTGSNTDKDDDDNLDFLESFLPEKCQFEK